MVYLIGGGGGGGDGGMIHSSPEKSSAGKMGHRRGMYCCLGGLTGPPWSQMVDMGPLVRDEVGWLGWDRVGGVLG